MPPKAKAKGSAGQAKAEAAAAGKVKAQARGLDKGRGALPGGSSALQAPACGHEKMGALRLGRRLLRQ